jgi:predicted nucleotidyltransferase
LAKSIIVPSTSLAVPKPGRRFGYREPGLRPLGNPRQFLRIYVQILYTLSMARTVTSEVSTVAEARAGLSAILRDFRADPEAAAVTIGSHRRPEAVLVPFQQFHAATAAVPRRPIGVLRQLREQSELIRRLASFSNIDVVAVFGSVARGTETDSSVVDLLVSPSSSASLFDLAQFEIDMSSLTGCDVNVISRRALHPERDKTILEEAIEL